MKIIVVSGGFDPIHSGHISYLKAAKKYGEKLIILLNSDDWLCRKKKKFFLPFNERKMILENLMMVDEVIEFEDDQIGSCINGLKIVKEKYCNDEIFFCNGGDRKEKNTPETKIKGINFIYSVGGDKKINSSSQILKEWKFTKEKRLWGHFYNIFESKDTKVKELVVESGKGMSFQKHHKRSEIWLVSQGKCLVNYSKNDASAKESIQLNKFDYFIVPVESWHQITNPYDSICKIIEIQYGEAVVEDDITRLYYYDQV